MEAGGKWGIPNTPGEMVVAWTESWTVRSGERYSDSGHVLKLELKFTDIFYIKCERLGPVKLKAWYC